MTCLPNSFAPLHHRVLDVEEDYLGIPAFYSSAGTLDTVLSDEPPSAALLNPSVINARNLIAVTMVLVILALLLLMVALSVPVYA